MVNSFGGVHVGNYSVPAFADLDLDGDLDLLVGQRRGKIFLYRNDGTPTAMDYILETTAYNNIDVGDYSAPALVDS